MSTYPWVRFYHDVIVTQVALHFELVQGGGVVHSDLGFFSVVAHPHSDVVVAAVTPDVVGHLKTDDDDAEVDFAGSFSKGMGAQEFVEPPGFGVIVRGVVLVGAFAFTHFCKTSNSLWVFLKRMSRIKTQLNQHNLNIVSDL